MTDNEIIKAFDILAKFDFFGGQRAGRELWNDKPVEIQDKDIESFRSDVAFLKDFINRQKVELDALKADIVRVCAERDAHICTTRFAKAEAVKEFAKRLKARLFYTTIHPNGVLHLKCINVKPEHIDNLVKEMVGEEDDR